MPGRDSEIAPLHRRGMLFRLGLLLFGGFFLTSAISYLVSRQSIRQSILEAELPLSSDNIYSEIQRDLFEPILISSLMANDTFVREWLKDGERDPARIVRYLGQIQDRYGMITSFLVSEATRKYYHSTGVLKTIREEEPADAWFFRVRKMETDYEINVDPDMANRDAMTIFINYRILGADDQFLGATGVGLTVNAVKELMRDYRSRFNRDIYFYDRDGNLVLHSLEPDETDGALADHRPEEGFGRILSRLKEGGLPEAVSAVSRSGSLANYRYIPELDWILVVEQASDRTRAILVRSFSLNLIVCLVISLLVLGIIRYTVLRYQRRLESRNVQLMEQKTQMEHQAAELAAANAKLDALHREKDDFIGVVVHDLKNPLNAVIGLSESLLAVETPPAEQRAIVSDIHVSALGMLDQVNSLLHLSELESRADLAASTCDLADITRRAVAYLQHAALRKKIIIDCDIPAGRFPVWGGEKWVLSAVGNILSNAIKFSPLTARVSVRLTVKEDRITVDVSDRGVGLSPADQARLFRKFERLSSRPTAGEGSSGLGLYLVHQIMVKVDGRVTCCSRLGEGSTFRLEFRPA